LVDVGWLFVSFGKRYPRGISSSESSDDDDDDDVDEDEDEESDVTLTTSSGLASESF
jgi:hypothetical protein